MVEGGVDDFGFFVYGLELFIPGLYTRRVSGLISSRSFIGVRTRARTCVHSSLAPGGIEFRIM